MRPDMQSLKDVELPQPQQAAQAEDDAAGQQESEDWQERPT